MDAELLWLEKDPNTLLMRKDCIDAFVGGIQKDGSNIVSTWVSQNNVQQVLFSPLIHLLTFRSLSWGIRSFLVAIILQHSTYCLTQSRALMQSVASCSCSYFAPQIVDSYRDIWSSSFVSPSSSASIFNVCPTVRISVHWRDILSFFLFRWKNKLFESLLLSRACC